MACVDENAAAALLEGRLAATDAEQLRAHALECDSCRQLVAELAKAATSPHVEARSDGVRRRGDAVGRYVVLGYLGEGGMGVVYLGYDPDLDRRVALKFLRGSGDAAWLVSEAQGIAKLAHPNVVSVFDIGRAADGVYIAMEYVPGVTLREWLAAERRDWRDIVARYCDAGRGLAAAHAAGIVHRDFKPDNVLVTDDRACVLDFGLAAHATSMAPRGGTPRYMAPEQAVGGEVGAAADQFSFCVALEEALRDQRVPARITAALARGRATDPIDRFPSMAALLAALVPQHRRAWLAIGAAAVAVGALSIYAIAWQRTAESCTGADAKLARVWNPPTKLAARAAFVGTGVPYASAAWQRTEDMLDRHGSAWAVQHTEVCRATARGEQSQRALDVRMSCLAQRLRDIDATATMFTRADAVVVEKAQQLAGALAPLAECAELDADAPLPPASTTVAASVDLVRGELARVHVLGQAGRYADAVRLATGALVRARTTAYAPVIADALVELGEAQSNSGAIDDAEATLRDAFISAETCGNGETAALAAAHLVRLVGGLRASHEQGLWWARIAHAVATRVNATQATRSLIASLHGDVLGRAGRFADAFAQLDDALRTRIAAFGADHLLVASVRQSIANVQIRAGKYDEAIATLRAVLAIRERALPPAHPAIADVHATLGDALAYAGKLDESLVELRTARALREQSLGAQHPAVADVLTGVGQTLVAQGKPAEALAELERARAILEPQRHAALASVATAMAEAYTRLRRFDDAERAAREGLALHAAQQGNDGPEVGAAHVTLANALSQRGGHDDEALVEYRRGHTILAARLGADHLQVAQVATNIGGVLEHLRRDREALAELEPALAIFETRLGPDHPNTAITRWTIGRAHLRQGRQTVAATELRRAVAGLEAAMPDDKVLLAQVRADLARAERTRQRVAGP